MKKIYLALMCTLMMFSSVNAQNSTTTTAQASEKITVDVNDLPADLAAKLKKKQQLDDVKSTVSTAAEVAHDARSIGHEIGVAVDEALGAVTKHADAFGKTDVGRFTMAMVFLSIMKDELPVFYKTILGTVFGIPFVIFVNILLFVLYFRTTRQYQRIKGYDANKKKEYEYCDTWYTGSNNTEMKGWFNFIFFAFTLIANVLTVSCVIF